MQYHKRADSKQQGRDRQRRVRAQAADQGKCSTCPEIAAPGRKMCGECLARHNARQKTYYRDNREAILAKLHTPEGKRRKREKLVKQYGLTLDDYDQMLAEQGSTCAICKKPEMATHWTNGEVRSLAVDHNHNTGQVRALLCHRCNRTLGLVEEDLTLLQAMQEYLKGRAA